MAVPTATLQPLTISQKSTSFMGPGAQGETVHCGQWSSSGATERWTSSWPMMQKWMWPRARLDFTQPTDSWLRLPVPSCLRKAYWSKITATGCGDSVNQVCWHPSNPDPFVTSPGDTFPSGI